MNSSEQPFQSGEYSVYPLNEVADHVKAISEQEFIDDHNIFDNIFTTKSDPNYAKDIGNRQDNRPEPEVRKESSNMSSEIKMSDREILKRAVEIIQKSQEEPVVKPEITELGKTFQCAASKEELGKTLVAARKEKGISQKDVAEAMGTKPSYVLSLEKGRANPSLESIQKYAKAIDHSLSIVLSC